MESGLCLARILGPSLLGLGDPRTKLSESFQSGLAMEAGLLEDELEEEEKSLARKTRLPLSRKWRELRCFLNRSIITILGLESGHSI